MWRLLAAVARNLENMKKSSRVADENMFAGEGNAGDRGGGGGGGGRRRRRQGLSLIHSILQASMSVILCVSSHGDYNYGTSANGNNDGFWGSGDYEHFSEMNQMIVSDSMRFAILM